MSAFPPIATSIAFFRMSALGQKRTSENYRTWQTLRNSSLFAAIDAVTQTKHGPGALSYRSAVCRTQGLRRKSDCSAGLAAIALLGDTVECCFGTNPIQAA